MTPMLVPVERALVGSDAHVAQFAALGEVAAECLVGIIAKLERRQVVTTRFAWVARGEIGT